MKILAIEGHDYAGKTSTAKLIVKKLQALDFNVLYLKAPNYESATGKIITSYLKGETVIDDPLAMAAIYSANRVTPMLKAVSGMYDLIVMDRCYVSNICTQFDYRNVEGSQLKELIKFAEKVKEIEFDDFNIPKPDKIVTLLCSEASIMERMVSRDDDSVNGNGAPDILETVDRIEVSRNNYIALSALEGHCVFNTDDSTAEDSANYAVALMLDGGNLNLDGLDINVGK